MKNSLQQLTQISETINSHQTYYKFNKIDEHLSEKYRNGRVKAASWLNELVFFFIRKESNFLLEFKEHIQEQKKSLSNLKDGDFKQGLYDELNLIEDMINDRINKFK